MDTALHEIKALEKPFRTKVTVPGSKSYTHRMLIAAALADGPSTIENALDSEDTRLTAMALEMMGAPIRRQGTEVAVEGCRGRLNNLNTEIDLENSGTSMRLLTAVAALGNSTFTLTGSARMQQRPIQELLDSLSQMGVVALSKHADGCPPVEIWGPPRQTNRIAVNCRLSSQYLSALMLIAPYVAGGLDIGVSHGPVSRPYVDITADVMQQFGVPVERTGYERFVVRDGRIYRSGRYLVEPDASQASYFWAAAALTRSRVTVTGLTARSVQGDLRLIHLMAAMGCRVVTGSDGITVAGGPLAAIDADMADMPDVVPTLAVMAAFADGTTRLRNVGHLAVKESNRLVAVVSELHRMGITAEQSGQDLVITGGSPVGAQIETYNDHRIAMSFAVAGLKVPGVVIRDPACVEKSFPQFWDVFETLYG